MVINSVKQVVIWSGIVLMVNTVKPIRGAFASETSFKPEDEIMELVVV